MAATNSSSGSDGSDVSTPRGPRKYGDVNRNRPREYWDYDNAQIPWGCQDDYQAIRKIGRGKYSEVFEGVNTRTGQRCVIKVLKPVKKMKIKREVSILLNLSGGPNIVRLLDVVRDPETKTPSLIFEYIKNVDFRKLYSQFQDFDIRYYMYQLCVALDFCHSQGVMHRDVKPHNVIIDHETRQLRLIDWGLADMYHQGKEYNVRVASRHYKGPELLVDCKAYDYSLDIWSLGCMLAGMIFRLDPFFHGCDNEDQLEKIVKVLGTRNFEAYAGRYGVGSSDELDAMPIYQPTPWTHFVTAQNRHLAVDDALDLLGKMLVFDHDKRILPCEAMKHRYFDPVRQQAQAAQAATSSPATA